MTEFITMVTTLFLIMDPIGNCPIFLSTLAKMEPKRRLFILLRELIFAYVLLNIFLFGGKIVLKALNLSQESISISGGIILFLIALKMIFSKENDAPVSDTKEEPFLVPLAIPMLAGPSIMATLILFRGSGDHSIWTLFSAMSIAWALSALILLASGVFEKVLKRKGMIALEKLMGMILLAISVQLFLDGIIDHIAKQNKLF